MDVSVGMRVVRGPNWKWGEQDGGEGGVGTVVDIDTLGKPEGCAYMQRVVVVQWDNGMRCNYRIAVGGQYDLLLLDNDPLGCKHSGVTCEECRITDITGMRWKCVKCLDTNLCSRCYHEGKHCLDHEYLRVVFPDGVRDKIPCRYGARRVMAIGFFRNAEVARGHDWLWGDQDGGLGKTGKLLRIRGWESENSRSIAEVEWMETGKCNVYRVGHKGKVDLKCLKPAPGGYYYPSHLPVLGEPPYHNATDTDSVPPNPVITGPMPEIQCEHHALLPGDNIRVELSVEVFKMMQEGHGDYDESLLSNLSDVGSVLAVLGNGDVRVKYACARVYTINHNAITKVTYFSAGDIVQVIDDIASVHNFQENHGGWVDDMALSLGQVGRITKVFPTGDVRVAVNSRMWTYNPRCLVHAPLEEVPEFEGGNDEEEGEDLSLQMKLLSVLDNPAVIVATAASGDVGTLRGFLRKHPSQVNAKAGGKAAIHCACAQGNLDVLKCLLEFSPNLEIEDEDGDRPMHLSAYSDEDEIAQLLIAANADVNSKNNRGATPLIIAAVKGHHSVLRVLTNDKNIQLHEQDTDGDTALHCAVLAQKNESINNLLEAGADPTLLNFRLFTPIHEAARIGFLSAVDHFIHQYPSNVDIRKDDGYTPLHLAALNNHIDVVTCFAEHEMCNVNVCTNQNQTALHLAVHQSHLAVVERLVGFGANLNVQDMNGDTPLHIALFSVSAEFVAPTTPQLAKIKDDLQEEMAPGVITACFLVQEGADLSIQNSKGYTPLQLSPPNVITVVMKFVERSSSFHGSMKLPLHQSDLLNKVGERSATGVIVKEVGLNEVCFLCEAPVDVKFEPCGHTLMCHRCAERAKKCPTCKNPVKNVYKLKEPCVMCNEDEGSVTIKPCGHVYCQECCRRIKVCFECRSPIERKEGLEPKDKGAPVQAASTNESQQSCAICLTEPRNTALQCGHLLCWDCAQRVDNCPVCRKFVHQRIRLFQ